MRPARLPVGYRPDTGRRSPRLSIICLRPQWAAIHELNHAPTHEFYAIRLAVIEDPAERVRLAFKLFDSEGVALVNLLSDGSGPLEDMRQRARDLVHRRVQKIHPFDALASPEPRERGARGRGRMNLLHAPVH